MEGWKRMIIEGNQSFNTNRFYSAENYYKIACDFASNMSPETAKCSDIIASLVVSYQNLAELYFKINQTDLALSQYQELHIRLVEFGLYYKSPEQLLWIQKAIRKIGTELLNIISKKGIESQRSKQLLRRITATGKAPLH